MMSSKGGVGEGAVFAAFTPGLAGVGTGTSNDLMMAAISTAPAASEAGREVASRGTALPNATLVLAVSLKIRASPAAFAAVISIVNSALPAFETDLLVRMS